MNLMGYRFTFIKLIDNYYNDSPIMSGLYRVFRKATQIITNEGSNNLDKSQLKTNPKDIAKVFRVNGLFKQEPPCRKI